MTMTTSIFLTIAALCLGMIYVRTQSYFVRPSRKDEGQALNGTVWLVVAVLAAIALIIFIITHVQTKK